MSAVTKRTRFLLPAIVLLTIGIVFSGCTASNKKEAKPAEVKTVVFHLNDFMPAMHPINTNMLEPLAKEVKEKTQGRVEIIVHPGNALAAPGDTYDAVVSGVAGMGFVLPAYTPGRFPMSQILEYPFMFTTSLQANLTAKEMTPMLREHEYKDTQLLWFGGTDLGHVLMKSNVKTLADLKGKKLRSPGPIYNNVIKAVGGVEVSLPVSDLYDSMDRGIVDGTVMAPSALISFRLMEVTNHIVEMNMYTTPLIFFANKDLWKQVSAADQKIIMDIVDTFPERIGKQYDFEVQHAMNLAKEKNKNIFKFSDADMAKFHALTDPLVKGWIADLEAKGKPGQKLYDLAVEAAKKY
jgi:TRAP-type C4-dicarboxylate transport system substrate-binding protein